MRFNHSSILLVLICACAEPNAKPKPATARADCDSVNVVGNLPADIREASGIAIGRRTPGILWVHNDDAPTILFALDTRGTPRGQVRVEGLAKVDWEDIAIAPCASGSCLFVGDMGDNTQKRERRTIHEVPEPLPTDGSVRPVASYPFHLPDKSHDAEALFVMPDRRMFIVTKGRSGPVTLYEFPQPLQPGVDVELRPVAKLTAGLVQLPDMVTGAGVTPDGKFIVIRTYSALQLYTLDGTTLTPVYPQPFSLESLNEPQGEGVDIGPDGEVFLVSERAMDENAPLSRLVCNLPR